MKMSIFEKNLKVLRKLSPGLAEAVVADRQSPYEYKVSPAKNGEMTLAIKADGKMLQVHSTYDPAKEAKQQIQGAKLLNPKILFIMGIGLGYHLRAALEQHAKENLFVVVVERDFKAFQTAMQNVDLSDILGLGKICWLIDVNEDSTFASLRDMIKQGGIIFQFHLKTVIVFEHPVLAKIHGKYYKHVFEQFRFAGQDVIINYGTCPDDSLIGMTNTMDNLGEILRNPGVKELFGAFKGVPGVVVSTGPSLDKNGHLLKQIEDKCVMICADSALMPLMKLGVTPHGYGSIERVQETVETYRYYPEERMADVFQFAPPLIVPDGYKAWKGPKVVVFRDFNHFYWLGFPKGILKFGLSCSNMVFKLMEALGCDPIILVGQDCSFPNADKTHAEGTRGRLINKLRPEQLFKVKGNYDEWVYTYEIFELFRRAFVADVAVNKGTVINATAGGAYIEGTVLMPLEEAIQKYCKKTVHPVAVFRKKLIVPDEKEIKTNLQTLTKTIRETISEVTKIIEKCEHHTQKIIDFEDRLDTEGYREIDDFLARFPTTELENISIELNRARADIISSGKYFDLFLMHVVQMVIVRFEMDLNEIPSLCDDKKRCQLQAVRLMRKWFPTIRDLCKIALKLLEESFEKLKQEFGEF
jgi:hypothetical protein